MSRQSDQRQQAALAGMIGGNLLYHQEKLLGNIKDTYIFQVPHQSHYCVMTVSSRQVSGLVECIECTFPSFGHLLNSLSGGGKYENYPEISIESQDGLRVLEMYKGWVFINNVRWGKNLLPPPPDDDNKPPSGTGIPSVRYA